MNGERAVGARRNGNELYRGYLSDDFDVDGLLDHLGDYVREHQLNISEVASLLGLGHSTAKSLTTSDMRASTLSLRTACRISKALGLSLDEFVVNDTDDMSDLRPRWSTP